LKRVVLAGGSGFLGQSCAKYLAERGYSVVVLTRSPREEPPASVHDIAWDGRTLGIWKYALDGAEAVINFTGKSVNCRYTPKNRRIILSSRLDSVNVIAEAISECTVRPLVSIQAASLAIYGNTQKFCDETSPHGEGFSVQVCEQWEQAFDAQAHPATRQVLLRIGFALGAGGGALETLARMTKLFLGGTTGRGNQYISWLHLDDLNEMFLWSIERPDLFGTYNATGPNPVTNAEFMAALRRVLHRPWSPPVPDFAVRLGARMMGTEAELALTGRRCIPQRFIDQQFAFKYPELSPALTDIFSS
jgi:uncharacterized protein (TIGR01777 family)